MDIEKFVTNTKIDLIRKNVFFGHIISQLPIIYVDNKDSRGVNTLAVGKTDKEEIQTKLYVNRDYLVGLYEKFGFDKLSNHLLEVLKHEIYHLIFKHLTIDLPDKQRLNIACECSVNSYIDREKLIGEGKGEKTGVFAEDFGLESKLGVHEYYRRLENNKKYKEMCNSVFVIMVGEGEGKGEKTGNKEIDSHELWKIVKDDPIAEEMLKDIIRQAVQTCKKTGKWGDVPSDLKEEIESSLEHHKRAIPWQIILKQFIASSSENVLDYTIKKRSKRYGTRPGLKKEDVLNLAIGIDTSGSVNNEMLELFFNELYWVDKTGADITIFEADTKIQREYSFREWDGSVSGRGGTDLEPLLKEVSDRKFDALIYFTDMEAPKIKERYNLPIMWVINNSYYKRINEMPYQEGIFLKLSDEGDSFEQIPF